MTRLLDLYHSNRPAWIAEVSPTVPLVFDGKTNADLAYSWRAMGADFQKSVWRLLSAEQKTRLKRVCREATQ